MSSADQTPPPPRMTFPPLPTAPFHPATSTPPSQHLAGSTSITYTTIRHVLETTLDQVDGAETVSNVPQNDYVRGAEAFMNI